MCQGSTDLSKTIVKDSCCTRDLTDFPNTVVKGSSYARDQQISINCCEGIKLLCQGSTDFTKTVVKGSSCCARDQQIYLKLL